MAATVDAIAAELARVLDPLRQRLEAGQLAALFAELGLELPAVVRDAPTVVAAAAAAATSATTVADELVDLVQALADEDEAAILSALAVLLPDLADGFDRAKALAAAVKAAYEASGTVGPELVALLSDLPTRLLDHLVVRHLEDQRPLLGQVLAVTGLIEVTPVAPRPGIPAHIRRTVRADLLGLATSDPLALFEQLYRWGDPTTALDATSLLDRLRGLLDVFGLPAAVVPTAAGPELRSVLFRVRPAAGGPPTGLDLDLVVSSLGGVDIPLPIGGDDWTVRVVGAGSLDLGSSLRVRPPAVIEAPTAAAASGSLRVAADRVPSDGHPIVVFGERDGTRLTADALHAAMGAAFTVGTTGSSATPVVDAAIEGGRAVVALAGADGFLTTFLPTELALDLDLAVTWGQDGLEVRGGAGLAMILPLDLRLGPVVIDRLDVGLLIAADRLGLEARATGGIALGPFSAVVEGAGAGADLVFRRGTGALPAAAVDLGPVALAFRFLPPEGLGLAVDAGPISGGGFIRFDEANGRYSGILELKLGVVGVEAIGLLDTRLPGDRDGFALLVVLRASFPPIQLGFGFALSSVGGLLALNRQVDVDALRDRMASGTVGRILAPEDPIRNAPVLIEDLDAVFPLAEGVVVVGPTLQLSWAELVRFDIGVFIELPGPRRIVLLGSARAGIDNPSGGRPYLQMRLDILGVVDVAAQTLSFDAVLIDSHLLEILELTGGAAFRLSWGAEPYVVLTVGGFHPAYSPAPLVFPAGLVRIAMVRSGPFLTLRFEGYFAVTTNTLQFGAAIEALISVGSFDIRGFLGFDALIRFQPFHFQFAIAASVKVRWKGHTLAGLTMRGEVTGPGPVVFHGKVCFEILWVDICFEETFTLGSSTPPAVTPIASAVAELTAELEDPANVRASAAADPRVTVDLASDTVLPVVSPLGQAVWSQERAPLDLLLQRFEGAPLSRPETVSATGPQVTGVEVDWFAPGTFAELSDADALNRRAFERLNGGVRLGTSGTDDGPATTFPVTVRQIRLPAAETFPDALTFPAWMLRATSARLGAVQRDAVVPALTVRDETWVVRGGDGTVVVGSVSQAQAHQLSTVAGAGTAVADRDVVPAMAF